MSKQVRSIFISDVHLGCRFSRSDDLYEFLKQYQAQYVYLVGDIIDGYKIHNGFYWSDSCNHVIRKLLGMAKKHDTKIRYILGNHDSFLLELIGHQFGHIEFVEEFEHITADGRKLLVTHGHLFDTLTKRAPWLYYVGDNAYTVALWLNQLLNHCRKKLGFRYWSISAELKKKVKAATNFINNFEHMLVKYAASKDAQGVVCGHIHHATIKEIDGITYYNTGDFVESCTGLIEYLDGSMELVYFHC